MTNVVVLSVSQGRMNYDKCGTSYYDGDWVNGIKTGHGVRKYCSGNMYEGDWKENLRHGCGAMYWYTTCQEYNGGWDHGVQVSAQLDL